MFCFGACMYVNPSSDSFDPTFSARCHRGHIYSFPNERMNERNGMHRPTAAGPRSSSQLARSSSAIKSNQIASAPTALLTSKLVEKNDEIKNVRRDLTMMRMMSSVKQNDQQAPSVSIRTSFPKDENDDERTRSTTAPAAAAAAAAAGGGTEARGGSGRSSTGNIYTVGLHDLGLAELLVQDVPRSRARMVIQTLRRLTHRLQTGHNLYTDSRIVEENRFFFRVIQVELEAYRVHLLRHVMKEWGEGYSFLTDAMLSSVQVCVLTPWFVEEMEDWATLPRAPRNQRDCRDKIFLEALFGDCRGGRGPREDLYRFGDSREWWDRASSSSLEDDVDVDEQDDGGGSYSSSSTKFSESDAIYFLQHTDYFLWLLDVPDATSFVFRMPRPFQRRVLALLARRERMASAAAAAAAATAAATATATATAASRTTANRRFSRQEHHHQQQQLLQEHSTPSPVRRRPRMVEPPRRRPSFQSPLLPFPGGGRGRRVPKIRIGVDNHHQQQQQQQQQAAPVPALSFCQPASPTGSI